MSAAQHEQAWAIPAVEGEAEGGIVVELGSRSDPYYWVLCPAAATLVLDEFPDPEEGDSAEGMGYSNPFCSDGDACDFVGWHREAARFILSRGGARV